MFGDWFLRLAAKLAGFSQRQLSVIEADMPATKRLVDLVIKLQPTVQQAVPIANELIPLIRQAMPLIHKLLPYANDIASLVERASPDISQASKEFQAIGPALNILISVIHRDLEMGKSRDDAFSSAFNKIKETFQWKGF